MNNDDLKDLKVGDQVSIILLDRNYEIISIVQQVTEKEIVLEDKSRWDIKTGQCMRVEGWDAWRHIRPTTSADIETIERNRILQLLKEIKWKNLTLNELRIIVTLPEIQKVMT